MDTIAKFHLRSTAKHYPEEKPVLWVVSDQELRAIQNNQTLKENLNAIHRMLETYFPKQRASVLMLPCLAPTPYQRFVSFLRKAGWKKEKPFEIKESLFDPITLGSAPLSMAVIQPLIQQAGRLPSELGDLGRGASLVVAARELVSSFEEQSSPVMLLDRSSRGLRTEKIFIPVFYPDKSQWLFDQAIELAKSSGSSISIFYKSRFDMENIYGDGYKIPFYSHKLRSSEKNQLPVLSEWIKKGLDENIRVELECDHSYRGVFSSLMRKMDSEFHDLVLLDGGLFSNLVLQRIMERVTCRARTPVLVLQRDPTYREWIGKSRLEISGRITSSLRGQAV